MNAERVWEQGVTGKGVVVSILDDGNYNLDLISVFNLLFFVGIERNNPDLKGNYVGFFCTIVCCHGDISGP